METRLAFVRYAETTTCPSNLCSWQVRYLVFSFCSDLASFSYLKDRRASHAEGTSTSHHVRPENSIIGAITHFVKPVPPFLASKRRKLPTSVVDLWLPRGYPFDNNRQALVILG